MKQDKIEEALNMAAAGETTLITNKILRRLFAKAQKQLKVSGETAKANVRDLAEEAASTYALLNIKTPSVEEYAWLYICDNKECLE